MSDPLDIILRIRRVTVDDAKRELAALLVSEECARLKADAADALIMTEGAVAADISLYDDAVETFAAWLPVGRANAALARADHERSRSEVARARAALTVARASASSAQTLLGQRDAKRLMESDRKAQASMDDLTLSRIVHRTQLTDG